MVAAGATLNMAMTPRFPGRDGVAGVAERGQRFVLGHPLPGGDEQAVFSNVPIATPIPIVLDYDDPLGGAIEPRTASGVDDAARFDGGDQGRVVHVVGREVEALV